MSEQESRAAIVTEALSWINTPYVIRGRVKGGGCDCGSFLMSVAVNCGYMTDRDMEAYSDDCWAHWADEKYLKQVMANTTKVLECIAYRTGPGLPLAPGTLVLTKAARSNYFNHGGIVVKWPQIIHALVPYVEQTDITTHFLWAYKPIIAFDFKGVIDEL